MSRWRPGPALFLLAAGLAAAQTPAKTPADPELPPDEDVRETPQNYTFNPVQSQREVMAGDFYFKKGNFVAAANRFREATKWNDGNAEAWLRLGEAEEKKPNHKAAREAYEKYLQIAPDAKNVPEVKKRLA